MYNQTKKNAWLIIPALNEAENLNWLLPKVRNLYNIIVVDNGSSDKTFQIAKSHGAIALKCPKKGYGIAVQTGLNHLISLNLDNPIFVIFDADGTSPWEKIPELIEPIISGNNDLVIGQRTHLMKGSMPIHADFGNWLQTNMIGFLKGYYFKDMGPMRALKLSSYQMLEMKDKTWGWNVEMQIKALQLGFLIKEIGLVYRPRKYGVSKISGSFIGSLRAGTKIIFAVFYYYLISMKMMRGELCSQKKL